MIGQQQRHASNMDVVCRTKNAEPGHGHNVVYHNMRHIFPVGYKATRKYHSFTT